MGQPKILIAEGEDDILCKFMKNFLRSNGLTVSEAHYKALLQTHVQEENIDLLLLCAAHDANGEALKVARSVRRQNRSVPIIMVAENSAEENVIAAFRIGVNDYFKYPFKKRRSI
ncbi:MAG: response regulator [Candidatus Kuenenia sp.]|nr:response regulator [Candidatus Kuenenia hertensis]